MCQHRVQEYLVAPLRILPTTALRDLRLDDAFVIEEVILGRPAEQFDLENKCRLLWDLGGELASL